MVPVRVLVSGQICVLFRRQHVCMCTREYGLSIGIASIRVCVNVHMCAWQVCSRPYVWLLCMHTCRIFIYSTLLTSAWHAAVRGSILGPGMLKLILGVETWLSFNIRYCISGFGSSVIGAPLRNLGKFVYPTLPVSFGCDTISRWSLISCVHARVK